MIQLTDYLYSGSTVIRILHSYADALEKNAQNKVDKEHVSFLRKITEYLEHNDFLTSQSQRIREFYKLLAAQYPFLAFTFRGRIKSLIRAEEKFNGYIVRYIYEYKEKYNAFPSEDEIVEAVSHFRDIIAYRIVISMPKCHLKPLQNKDEIELQYLYEIANQLPLFMQQKGFIPEKQRKYRTPSPLLNDDVKQYYRDYIYDTKKNGYRSLHISFFDTESDSHIEIQLRTKEMDDFAEIGDANHTLYEEKQNKERSERKKFFLENLFSLMKHLIEKHPCKISITHKLMSICLPHMTTIVLMTAVDSCKADSFSLMNTCQNFKTMSLTDTVFFTYLIL